jgi:hypothetical protein
MMQKNALLELNFEKLKNKQEDLKRKHDGQILELKMQNNEFRSLIHKSQLSSNMSNDMYIMKSKSLLEIGPN